MNREEIKQQAKSARSSRPIHTLYQLALIAADELIDQQAAELERLREQTQWMPIDSAPRDGTWFLYEYAGERGLAQFCPEYGHLIDEEGESLSANHWMPLPEPTKCQ